MLQAIQNLAQNLTGVDEKIDLQHKKGIDEDELLVAGGTEAGALAYSIDVSKIKK
jgi:hypothetical protein